MIITRQEAKKTLWNNAKNYSDAQVEEIVNVFTFLSDLAIDSYIGKKNENDKQKAA